MFVLTAADPTSASGHGGRGGRQELRPHRILGGPDSVQRLPQPGLFQLVTGTHTFLIPFKFSK